MRWPCLAYHHQKHNLPKFEYIVAMEPQRRGAWHAHLLLIYPSESPFIPNAILREIWGHGFVKIGKLDNVDNVGVYLTAYLSDMELPDKSKLENSIEEKEALSGKKIKTINGKRYAKGARLYLYPPKFNLYRCSRGIKPPTVEHITEAESKEKVGAATPTFERTIELSDPETGFSIVINKRYYNRNRKKGQGPDYDASNGNRGVFSGTASKGQQPEDGLWLSSKAQDIYALHREYSVGGDELIHLQAILYPPDREGEHLDHHPDIHPFPSCFPHLVL